MGFGNILSTTDVSATGLAAERLRMEVIANNIANANTTRTSEGGPFRRREVVFATALEGLANDEFGGVRVAGIQPDDSELPRVYRPGHPDADDGGYVTMPNVSLSNEMVDLITASRAYDANLRSLRTFRELVENALSLLQRA